MRKKKGEMKNYLSEVVVAFEKGKSTSYDPAFVDGIPLSSLECLYVFDLSKNAILHHRGFDKVFGYKAQELDLDFIFSRFHPDDAPLVQKIVIGCVKQFLQVKIPKLTNLLNVSYRFARSDGHYADIMSNTVVLANNSEGLVQQLLVKYTDISFTHNSDVVEWIVNTDHFDTETIHQLIFGDRDNLFTTREREVIDKMFEGGSNQQIAQDLYISQHTVATHRKNILFKSGCHDVQELFQFCKANGIV